MRKVAPVGGSVCVAVALLFFLVPVFRQALGVSLTAWKSFFSVKAREPQPSLRELAQQAEEARDAKALAFVAVRLWDEHESARLADEAVQLDPKLTWVYGIVASQHAELPEVDRWVNRLEQWDPENAFPHLIAADRIEIVHILRRDLSWRNTEDAAWNEAMAAAFKAAKLDDYLAREVELDGDVVRHRHFFVPLVVLAGLERVGLPSYSAWHCLIYSHSRVTLAQDLEAKGDLKHASEGYWTVARFGQLLEFQGHAERVGAEIQAKAYQQLQALSEKAGNYDQTTLFSYLAQQSQQRSSSSGAGLAWLRFSRGNAWAVQSSGLLVLAFGLLILVWGLYAVARRWLMPTKLAGGSPGMMVAGLVGAIGFCVSCITLYVSYRPYAEIFNRFILYGDTPQLESLWLFRGLVEPPYLLWGSWQNRLSALHAFWFGMTTLCILGVALLIIHRVVSRLRAGAPA